MSNSLTPDETPSYSASHPDPICLHMTLKLCLAGFRVNEVSTVEIGGLSSLTRLKGNESDIESKLCEIMLIFLLLVLRIISICVQKS